MLTRQKVVLELLRRSEGSLSPTVFVKLMFLLRHETALNAERSFYDFVPYRYGPFSFQLYRDLAHLRRDGHLTPDDEQVAIPSSLRDEVQGKESGLPRNVHRAMDRIVETYGRLQPKALLQRVYGKYPWFAARTELTDLRPAQPPGVRAAKMAVYTVGYEGKSVDAFFDGLLRAGVEAIVDVRANPVSRKYGFAQKSMREISGKLGLGYEHFPELGIPGEYRRGLNGPASYRRLLNRYDRELLPKRRTQIDEVSDLLAGTPSALLCMEKDSQCCHRSRLAEAVAQSSGLPVVHL